jgi:hypothetical protein
MTDPRSHRHAPARAQVGAFLNMKESVLEALHEMYRALNIS